MGGAKCSYKNCTVRSDRKTHMFHYPVLDRPRCHQWLINSNRYDYLSLTVSQLKNRRICQHHFTIDAFMNETMTKLKSNAIPTVDGPYCDLEKLPDNDPKLESFDCVVFEDIENLKYPRKYLEKDTFSKRYSNFLTDSDVNDEDTFKDNKVQPKPILNTPESVFPYKLKQTNKTKIKKPITRKTDIKQIAKASSKTDQLTPSASDSLNTKTVNIKNNNPEIRATKIQIISEENWIVDPVPVIGPFKPVKPNTILSLPNKKYKKINKQNNVTEPDYTLSIDDKLNITIQDNNNIKVNSPKPTNVEEVKETIEIEIPPLTKNENIQNKSLDIGSIIDLNPSIKTSTLSITNPNKSLLKLNATEEPSTLQSLNMQNVLQPVGLVKLNPERATAIQKKRNFNKRLRDMISFQMDLSSLSATKPSCNVADINNPNVQKKTIMNPSEDKEVNIKQSINHSALSLSTPTTGEMHTNNLVKSHLSEDNSLPNIQSYNTLVAIEARMKHMEELMLSKIEHNTQTIVNLKKSVEEKCVKKYRAVSTQTESDELSNKKYLYREISKYLSTDANSLIYEELFINKLVASAPKRRKVSL